MSSFVWLGRSSERQNELGSIGRAHRRFFACRQVAPVENADVDGKKEDNEEVVEETEKAKRYLWDNVQRRYEVEQGHEEADEDSKSKHPYEATEREEVQKAVSKYRRKVPDVFDPLKQNK